MANNSPIYLDYNATTPIAKEVADEMAPFLYNKFGNPSSNHPFGVEAKLAVENARQQVAKAINSRIS
jgi:cysteine desulfurase